MNIDKMDATELRACLSILADRRGTAANRAMEIETGFTQKLIKLALGEITADELDRDTAELILCREIVDQDTTDARRAFTRQLDAIDRKEKAAYQLESIRNARLAFATKWNAFLKRTTPFNMDEFKEAAAGRTSDVDSVTFYRAELYRADYATLPDGTMSYAAFCKISPIDIATIV